VDQLLARRKRKGKAEAALIAIDPRTGDILAMVGGRSYNQSQYNRAMVSRRQPGSVFKPFVYLTAFEEAADKGMTDVTPASLVNDEPATWEYDDQVWTPENYEGEYDGIVTYRRALAKSRNLATIKVAERAGYDKVAALWKRLGAGNPPKPFPSIALGVFEATPFEIATAYTIFPNSGVERLLQHIVRIESGGVDVTKPPASTSRTVTRPTTAYLVTNMLESVINEGTASSARDAGFKLEAGGKTGTTNDLRDAWFVGFTPELLTVVWVGFDDNQPVGLSGAQAALPIWTPFMMRAFGARAFRLRCPKASALPRSARPVENSPHRVAPRHFQKRFLPAPSRPSNALCTSSELGRTGWIGLERQDKKQFLPFPPFPPRIIATDESGSLRGGRRSARTR
jgi:penicillin-binding protein 1B